MKIILVGESVSGFGGIETVIRKLVGFLSEDENKVEVSIFFLCRKDNMDKYWLDGINTHFVYSNIRIFSLRRIKFVYSLSSYIKKENPDIIIAFDSLSCLISHQARKFSGRSFSLFSWVHYSLNHKKHSQYIVKADYHLAISSGIKQQLLDRGVDKSTIYTVFNPVTPQTSTILRPMPEQGAIFLYVGRMKFEGQKRLKDLLDTLSKLHGHWCLHAIGDGSDLIKCQEYANSLNINDNILWHGWQRDPWQFVQSEIKHVTAFVMTSAFEGLPMTLLEAMSYGIYCVSSDCPSGPSDIIISNINGELYPLADLDALQKIFQRMIDAPQLPSPDTIKNSINHFYDREYYTNIKSALSVLPKNNIY